MCKFTILVKNKRGNSIHKHSGRIKGSTLQEAISNLSIVYRSFFINIVDVKCI